ncbi:MAG: ATP-dependent Clp protease proteolytic subunit [Yoonia sp.]|uniref:ATP-dependent Clp protease proteolytic subunit n=1 Tax=Yoonia sp. TaxID=2212373 RepID=UPI003266E43D
MSKSAKRGPGTLLKLVLFIQLGFAVMLFGSDLVRVLPQAMSPSDAPQLTEPLRPGDQTRRFDPAQVPAREASPNSRPLPNTGDMPSRLLFESVQWEGRDVVTMTGEIQPGDAARFDDFIDREGAPEVVFLNSPGGSVTDALVIGQTIRDMESETAMSDADVCLSACPYILAAGTTRDIPEGAWVGVHQHFFGENIALPAFLAVEDIQRGQGDVMTYLDKMGIDPLVMQHALVTPPDEIYLLTQAELRSYNFLPEIADDTAN